MASIIDHIETAALVTEVAALLRKHDQHLNTNATLLAQVQDNQVGEANTVIAIADRLTRPLSATARHELTKLLVPDWVRGRMVDLLTDAWLMDPSAWAVTLETLTECGWVPFIDARCGARVTKLVRRSVAHDVARRREPCRSCMSAWVEDFWRSRLHLTCVWCGRDIRTQTRAPAIGHQPKLW